MGRLILTIEVEVDSMTRAKTLRDGLQVTLEALPEECKLSTRYDETISINDEE